MCVGHIQAICMCVCVCVCVCVCAEEKEGLALFCNVLQKLHFFFLTKCRLEFPVLCVCMQKQQVTFGSAGGYYMGAVQRTDSIHI